MADETAGGGITALRQGRGPAWVREGLSPWTCYGIAAAIAICAGYFFWHYEGTWENIAFAVGISLALIAVLTLLTRRLMFSVAAVMLLCTVVSVAASIKRETMNMVVHAYDLFFYLSSWSTLHFLATEYPGLVAKALLAISAVLGIAVLAFRYDSSRTSGRPAFIALVAASVLATWGWANKGERRHMQFYFENLYVSSFYASWGETVSALWNGTILEAAPRGSTPLAALTAPQSCRPVEKPPHIILIHQESVVQPSLFPGLGYDKSVDAMFKSYDGALRTMRVETYGGASWLSEFSILAGVSTQAFGGMRQFVQTFTVNKLKDTLPQRLAQCGYRNVVVYPMMRNFVSNDKFYNSIALNEIIDMGAMKAKTAQERDKFYYGFALAEMDKHFKTSQQPLFTYIQTMSAHWPYDFAYEKDEQVAGGAPGTHPEMHEYLRRVSLAKRDYDGLIADLKQRFPTERFLIVHYGDHHPSSTRMMLGFKDNTEVEDVKLDENSLGYITYFALDGLNYQVAERDPTRTMPRSEAIDIPYLGAIVQAAAGLPQSDATKERLRLMQACKGRYNSCADRSKILSFHRRLIDAGIIVAR
jgi:phosphoglycerol transferase MdoB-like AlkP superfamily enzyme